jgi:UbiD family decarboxylase
MNEIPLVARARTVNLMVPACAEYTLEGKILADTFEDEGPFGEYTGYSTSRSTRNVFDVTAVSSRRDPIYQDLVPGYAWEHLLLSQFTKEILLLHKLKKEIPEVTALSMPKNGCHFHAYLSLKPKAKGQAKQAMMLLFGLDHYLKLIVAVNDDVNVYDEEEVLWAAATHVQAGRDVFIVPDVLCNRLDPSSSDGVSDKMGIDATGSGNGEAARIALPDEVRRQAEKLLTVPGEDLK